MPGRRQINSDIHLEGPGMNDQPGEEICETIFRDYAWKFFQVHADQRIRVFQFYIAISTTLFAGAIAASNLKIHAVVPIIGIFVSFISFIFWKLDSRTAGLVKNAEEAIKKLDARHKLCGEEDGGPNRLELFARDDFLVKKRYGCRKLFHFSYRNSFNCMFLTVGALGLIVFFFGALRICGWI